MPKGVRTVLICAAVAAALPFLGSSLLAISSDAAEIELQMANLLFADGRYIEALDTYERVQACEDPHIRRRALMGSVRAALRLADYMHAHADAETLVKMGAGDADVIALYGDALWALGLFEESEQRFRDALALQPDLPRALHGLARSLASEGKSEEALASAQAALRLGSRDAEIHHTVGAIYERMRRYPEATKAYGDYVNLLPNKDRSAKGAWARAEIRFLKAFGRKEPLAMEGAAGSARHTLPF